MLESNDLRVQKYCRTTELLSLSCFLVVITLKGQRRVFLTIQINARQQVLFKRKLRVAKNNRYESAGSEAYHKGLFLSLPLSRNLQKAQQTSLDGSIPIASFSNLNSFLYTLTEHFWPRPPTTHHNATKSPNLHTIHE